MLHICAIFAKNGINTKTTQYISKCVKNVYENQNSNT